GPEARADDVRLVDVVGQAIDEEVVEAEKERKAVDRLVGVAIAVCIILDDGIRSARPPGVYRAFVPQGEGQARRVEADVDLARRVDGDRGRAGAVGLQERLDGRV